MRKSAFLVAATVGVIVVGLLVNARPGAAQESTEAKPGKGTEKSESGPKASFGGVRVKTRGSVRSEWFSADMIDNVQKSYTFVQETEMDVTSLTFFSDMAPTTTTRTVDGTGITPPTDS